MKQEWEIKKLGDVCEIVKERPKVYQGIKNYYSTGSINNNGNYDAPEKVEYLTKPSRADSYPKLNDIGFAKMKLTNKVFIISENLDGSIFSTGFCFLRPTQHLLSKYLYYYVSSDSFQDLKNKYSGDGIMGGIKNSDVLDIQIPTPSIKEQQRVINILDEAFAVIANAKANAEQNLQNAKELFESYLQGVFENKDESWEEKTLGEIAFVKSGGTPSRAKKEYWEGDIPWYSSGELNEMYTTVPERHINSLAINNSNAKIFPKGSLLIGMYDTAALKMSIIDRDATFNQAVAGVKPNENIDLIFILHSINSMKPDLLNLRRGVRQKNLSLEKIKNIPVFLPNLKAQQNVVQKLDTLSTETKKLEAIYQYKINDLEELKKSVLQKAFSGELKTSKVGVMV